MEREIMCRGKLISTGTWVEGSLFNSIWRKLCDGSRVCYIFPDNKLDADDWAGDSWQDFAEVAEEYEVDPETVGQFTGLKDKSGKKIYEGDIVSATVERKDFKSIVSWGTMSHAWSLKCPYKNHYGKDCLKYYKLPASHKIKIIGNIHDNAQLLRDMDCK